MTQSIGKIYSDLIKEKFIKNKLRQGIIPSIEEVNDYALQSQSNNSNFNSPLLKREDYEISYEERSSAAKLNNAFSLLKSDLSVCIKSLLIQGNKITDMYDSTFSKLEGYEKKLQKIQSKITNLLFESKNSDIHEDIFYEKFESKEMINSEATTAEIDENTNSVSVKASSSNVISLSASSDGIQVVTIPNSSIVNSLDLPGLEIQNLINNTNNTWQHQVSTREPLGQVSVDIILRLPSNSKEVNKIIIEPASADVKTQINLEIAHSKDGLNWIFPNGENKKRLVKLTSFDFQFVNAEYWRLRLTKLGNDGFFGNSYIYNFGLKNLMFLGKEYQKITRTDESILYSKLIEPSKLQAITALSLKVCETKPQQTNIKYELAPMDQDEIQGFNDGTIGLSDLKYYLADFKDKDSFVLDMLKLLKQPIINNIKASHLYEYKDQREFDYMLHQDISQLNKSDTVLLRNEGINSEYETIGKSKKIRNIAAGWSFTNLYYSTYVFISNPTGKSIDIGSTEMIVNGTTKSGKITLAPGLNHIASLSAYWQDIDLSTLPFNSEVKVDPLYPYNHKYLIEGIGETLYGHDTEQLVDNIKLIDIIDPDQVYRSQNQIWQYRMQERSFEKFESEQKSTLDVFSYKVDNTNQERIVVKSNPENGLLDRETFALITKVQNSNPIKGLIFKATLSTSDIKTTPVLTEYLLKFR